MKEALQQLGSNLEGDLYHDITMRTLYATDASAYREMPLAIAVPRSKDDLKKLITFARTEKVSRRRHTAILSRRFVQPRAALTGLEAGGRRRSVGRQPNG